MPTDPNSPTPSTKVTQIFDAAGKLAQVLFPGITWIPAGVNLAKVAIGMFNKSAAPSDAIVLTPEEERRRIEHFIATAQLTQDEGQAVLDRWEADAERSGENQ